MLALEPKKYVSPGFAVDTLTQADPQQHDVEQADHLSGIGLLRFVEMDLCRCLTMRSSILTRKVLRRGEFDSRTDLVQRMLDFIEHRNTTATPFKWVYYATSMTLIQLTYARQH